MKDLVLPADGTLARIVMLGLSPRPSAAPLSSYRKVPRSGERVQEPTTTACGPTLPTLAVQQDGSYLGCTGNRLTRMARHVGALVPIMFLPGSYPPPLAGDRPVKPYRS